MSVYRDISTTLRRARCKTCAISVLQESKDGAHVTELLAGLARAGCPHVPPPPTADKKSAAEVRKLRWCALAMARTRVPEPDPTLSLVTSSAFCAWLEARGWASYIRRATVLCYELPPLPGLVQVPKPDMASCLDYGATIATAIRDVCLVTEGEYAPALVLYDLLPDTGPWSDVADRQEAMMSATTGFDELLIEALLSAEQRQPGECAQDVYERGEAIAWLAGPRSWMIERWVREVARIAEVPVDWNMSCGRALVSALLEGANANRREAVKEVFKLLLPALREAALRAKARGDVGAFELMWSWQ